MHAMFPDDQSQSPSGADEFEDILTAGCASIGLAFAADQIALMWRHYELVIEANRRFNLTRITTLADVAVRHYADSLSLLASPFSDREASISVLDVGTGAGFPAIPLAIVCPRWRVTAIDGTRKKVEFVRGAAGELGLANVEAIHTRAADLARRGTSRFDLVLLRAVAPIARGLNEVYKLIAPGGAVLFYKTAQIDDAEMREGTAVARALRLCGAEQHDLSIRAPNETLHRKLISFTRPGR